jgi:hypothetical protein
MPIHTKKIVVALLGVLLCAAGLFLVPALLERQTESQVTAFLQKIPGGVSAQSVKADFRHGKIVLQGIAGTGKRLDGGDFTFRAEELSVENIETGSLAASGPTPLFGLLRTKGLNIRANIDLPGFGKSITQTISVADLSLRDVCGDLNRLLQSYGAGPDGFIDALVTFRAGIVDMQGYAVDSETAGLGPVLTSLESMTIRDMSLLGMGGGEARGFKLSAFGMDVVTIEKMRAASVSVPNLYRYAGPTQRTHDGRDMLHGIMQALETAPVILQGMEWEGVSLPLNFPAGKGIRIAGTSADARVDPRRAMVRVTLSGLTLPPETYRIIPVADGFARTYGRDLHIDAVLDVEGTLEGKSGNITVNKLSLADTALASLESNGAFAFTLKGGNGTPQALSSPEAKLFLKNFRVVIEDFNLVNVMLAAVGDNAAARAATAGWVRNMADDENEAFMVKPLRGLAQLVAAPGRLSVAVNPAVPLSLSDSPDATTLRLLNSGITVDYTPR